MTDGRLRDLAEKYVPTIIRTLRQEYPNDLRHTMTGPDDRPTPRELHPAFYGCFDWHSSVEMHWALVRLLRLAPDSSTAAATRAVLDEHLTTLAIERETAYFDDHRGFKRPYGWGWLLMLAHELELWDDADARRWAANVAPLSNRITALFVAWLPGATYPVRDGHHANSAFGLARALPWAGARAADGDPALLDAVTAAARRWFGDDTDYPAAWEPGGGDFLSPALAEAELMAAVLPASEFAGWFARFLPGLAEGRPASLLEPATVDDPSDGQSAHLHGLNLYRAYAFHRLARAGEPAARRLTRAAENHAKASLPSVIGEDYMVEHWLACYAVLLLTA